MKKLLSTFFLLVIYFGYGHDIKMAIFEIYEGESGLQMIVSLDREDFLTTLANEFQSKVTSKNLDALALQYLESRIAIEVDGHCTSFTIKKIEFSDLNIRLKGSLNIKTSQVCQVRMTNTCMVDLIPDHDNIMKLKLNNKIRSFRLNSDRTSTTATY